MPVHQAQALDRLLTYHGIEHKYVEYEGDHKVFDANTTLQFMSENLLFEAAD